MKKPRSKSDIGGDCRTALRCVTHDRGDCLVTPFGSRKIGTGCESAMLSSFVAMTVEDKATPLRFIKRPKPTTQDLYSAKAFVNICYLQKLAVVVVVTSTKKQKKTKIYKEIQKLICTLSRSTGTLIEKSRDLHPRSIGTYRGVEWVRNRFEEGDCLVTPFGSRNIGTGCESATLSSFYP